MSSRLTFLACLLVALLLPPLVERALPAEAVTLPPAPRLERFFCDSRRCTVQWRLVGNGRFGAVLIAPGTGTLLDDAPAAAGLQTAVFEREYWRPGQRLQVLEWGEDWERRTNWTPTAMYLHHLER